MLPATVHVYDADTYLLGEREIRKEDVLNQLLDAEEELLSLAGLFPTDYRIQELCWNGEIYMDDSGQQCRDAFALGQKRVFTCQARYAGPALFEAAPSYLTPAWETEIIVTEEAAETDTVSETAAGQEYDPQVQIAEAGQEQDERALTLWERITRWLMWAVGIGVLLFFLGLLLLMGLYVAKKLHLWYDWYKTKRR